MVKLKGELNMKVKEWLESKGKNEAEIMHKISLKVFTNNNNVV
jgi:hypothetical protein